MQHNLLTRLDGNGVFVSGYTRDVTINDNEMSWIADNPMASWGYAPAACLHNTKGYSSTYLAMGFANVRAGTRYPPEH